ncbi:MarR family transcriptional regulator [Gordonia sihwensis]|uniref:MarR family transcriptional regulator n=1 Tax=Gordonia sihwensis TaxID=173559 RepID=UPI0005EF81CA|nr:MarR family transcriptional regulator [Gordonia sihwensis]KJR10238.1 hypothetical protein UG54_01270 [Gordonia sihwensis]
MTTATPFDDLGATERAQLFTIGCAWSGTPGRYRIDPTREHRYRTARSAVPGTPAPDVPWAVLTTDGTQRTMLAADFDGSKGGDPIADAEAFSALLAHLGCAHLVCRSSRDSSGHDSGNRHVLALLQDRWDQHTNSVITTWLTHAFATFDATPMSPSRTAAIRFPGSPHRGGGAAELAAISAPDGTDPAAVLTGAVRAPADLHTRLMTLAAAAAAGHHLPAHRPAPARTIDSPAVLSLLIRSAADVIDDRSGTLQPADPHPTLTAVDTPRSHSDPAADSPTLLVDADGEDRETGAASELLLPVRDPAERVAVSKWAPRRDAARALYPLSWYTRRWAPAPHTDDAAVPTGPTPAETQTDSSAPSPLHDPRLPAPIRALLGRRGDLAPGTASGLQHGALMSLIAHDYTLDEVIALALSTRSAAFTHSRRHVVFGKPIARTEQAFVAHLRRQYAHAEASLTRHANTRVAEEHRAAVDELATLVVQVLAAADTDPRLQFDRYSQTIRRTLEAHLLTALAAAASEYRCGARDLARSAGLRSPQTAATHTRTLTAWGYLALVEASRGTLANRYELRVPPDWTQGEPAPNAVPNRDHLGTLLAARCGHFQHDVWLSPPLGADAALVLLHLTHLETPAADIAFATGIPPQRTSRILRRLTTAGLLDSDGNPLVTQQDYETAAQQTGAAGAWSKVLRQWEIERARWAWWCSEGDFLRAPRDRKHDTYLGSVLAVRGRYPRTADGNGDHHAAAVAVAATLPALTLEAR